MNRPNNMTGVSSAAALAIALLLSAPLASQSGADERDPAVNDPLAMLEADPGLSTLIDEYDALYDAWQASLECALMQSDNAAIRLAVVKSQSFRVDESICVVDGQALDADRVYDQALREAGNDPALLLARFWLDCTERNDPILCDKEATLNQLLALEPGNALFHLLPMMSDQTIMELVPRLAPELDLDLLPETPAITKPADYDVSARDLILAASGAEFFDVHHNDHQYALYQAILEYSRSQPPPDLTEDLQARLEPHGLGLPVDPAQLPTGSIWFSTTPYLGFSFQRLLQHCSKALAADDQPLVAACNDLAELLIDTGKTSLAVNLGGRALKYRLAQKAAGGGPEALAIRKQKRALDALVTYCESPRILNDPEAWPTMPADHYRKHVRDLSGKGELAAYLRTAQREYAFAPEHYAVEPVRCKEAYELDEDTQQALVAVWRDPQGEGTRESLQASLATLAGMLPATTGPD